MIQLGQCEVCRFKRSSDEEDPRTLAALHAAVFRGVEGQRATRPRRFEAFRGHSSLISLQNVRIFMRFASEEPLLAADEGLSYEDRGFPARRRCQESAPACPGSSTEIAVDLFTRTEHIYYD